jgi:hypothetical protein
VFAGAFAIVARLAVPATYNIRKGLQSSRLGSPDVSSKTEDMQSLMEAYPITKR